ncbi:MAG: hypothetical protein CMQ07_07785, partial [Gammaproteobacteria bacterium]|nr:hypothetical protein [Gammaproteobacteria bacterium]
AALDPTAVGALDAQQMAAFDPAAMAGFDQSKVAALDPTAVGALDAQQMAAFDPAAMAGFDQSKVAALDPTAVGSLDAQQMAAFDPTAMAGFDQNKVAALDPTAMGALDAAQMAAFDPTAMAGFDQSKVAALDPTAVGGLTPDQMKAFDPSAVAGLQKDQVSSLSKDAVGGLSSSQFEALPDAALAGLDRDNLGGLDPLVMGSMTDEVIAKLDPEEVKGLAGDDFSKLATNVDVAKVSNEALENLLPSGWQMDASSGDLTAPPGAKIAFKELTTEPGNDDTSLPPLPDLSKDLAIGGGSGDASVIEGLNKALDAANAGTYEFEQRADGILNVKADGSDDAAAAFIPDTANMVQAPEGAQPGLSVDERGAYVLTTDKGYQIPLLPAIANPDSVQDILPPDSKIEIGSGGQTTISDLGDGRDSPVVGIPSPLTGTSDKDPGAYASGSGSDEIIEIVNQDGTTQVLTPAFKDQEEIETAIKALSDDGDAKLNTDGSVELVYGGQQITLKPHFDVESVSIGINASAGISQEDGKFFFTDSSGNKQELSVVAGG